MVVGMTPQQNRALWGAAFRELAAVVESGGQVPTSVVIWTQYVSPAELLSIADGSTPEPLKINGATGAFPSVDVPVGQPLDLDIRWSSQVNLGGLDTHDRQQRQRMFATHNDECLRPIQDDEPTAPAAHA